MGFFLFHIASFVLIASYSYPISQEEKIYTVSEVSVKPEPVSGLEDFKTRWSKKVVYPEDAIKENIQGVVFIEFVVNRDGTIEEAAVRQGIDNSCDAAALTEFKELVKEAWKPGMRNNEPVKVKMVLPFFFKIVKG